MSSDLHARLYFTHCRLYSVYTPYLRGSAEYASQECHSETHSPHTACLARLSKPYHSWQALLCIASSQALHSDSQLGMYLAARSRRLATAVSTPVLSVHSLRFTGMV